MASVSGMAALIRASTESETFDLAGQNVMTITNTIQSAFSEPLPLHEMIRITFVTGAGKLGRQKYNEGAAKAVTSTLKELGFEEDRGASCVVECAGSFKLQHDTGKNLKTVVVFPKILKLDVTGLSVNDSNDGASQSLLKDGSSESMIALSSMTVFERMLSSKCPSWSQKKGCVGAIESFKSLLQGLDQNLMNGTPLSDAEQEFYDSVSLESLEAKESCARKKMQEQVEGGKITQTEREVLLKQVSERLEKVQNEIAESSTKPKKIEKFNCAKEKIEQRKALLQGINPKPPHQLRHESEIHKLLTEMAPLQKLEEESAGRLLSVKETQMIGRKIEIEQQIVDLEEASRGWFEDDDFFDIRVNLTREAFTAKHKLSKKKSVKKTTPAVIPKWVTPGQIKSGASKATPKPKKAKQQGASGLFAAMMMDSDSD
mmetsp:Transcript_13234/g.19466  ORF Transcript_13234/g.19466 Transcript_13234/m.19466 type:complete len:430 (+) Transcript_13234:90-1379(+)